MKLKNTMSFRTGIGLGHPVSVSVLFEEYVSVNILKKEGCNVVKIETQTPNPLRAYTLPVNIGTEEFVGDFSFLTQHKGHIAQMRSRRLTHHPDMQLSESERKLSFQYRLH